MTIRLERTCEACPEQYDAFQGDRQVGYLRLRYGLFTVQVPDERGDVVYRAAPMGDGIFQPDERPIFLKAAVQAIEEWLADVPAIIEGQP